MFQPEEILLSGTSYQVKVDAEIEDTLGNPLGESYIWAFDTRKPTIYNFALKGGEQNPSNGVTDMPLDQSFVVTFEQPMDVKSTEAAIKLINSETKAAFPVNFTWSDDNATLLIEPKTKFSIASFYELTIADSAQAEDGGTLNAGMSVRLATVPLPAVSSVFPEANSDNADFHSSITIWFASQMNIDSLKGRVQITPAVQGMEDNWYYNSYDRSLLL